ncbi:hypothetical protein CRENBAI_002373, partial [Crenichthys baileyi]
FIRDVQSVGPAWIAFRGVEAVEGFGSDLGKVLEGTKALLMSLATSGKKLFLWREVLVLMDRSLLPEGRV